MQKINLKDLTRWVLVPPGAAVEFNRPEARTVRVEVNPEGDAGISVIWPSGEVQFLAEVSGMTLLEFAATGAFQLVSDATVWMYSAEFEKLAFEVPDPIIFTKIATRRQRSPEMDYMMEIMHKNQERLFAKLDQERASNEGRIRAIQAEHSRALASRSDQEVSGEDDGDGQPSDDTDADEVADAS